MSVGNATQSINFANKNLVLVIGENMDLGGDDAGARNGTGKTTIINALSYVFFGEALTNIRRDNLVNKTNNKGMLVTLTFEKDGREYKIERGRGPNLLKFYVDGQELAQYKSEKEARKNAKQLISLLGEDFESFIEDVLTEPEPSIEDSFGFANGLKGNQTYDDVAKKIATIE